MGDGKQDRSLPGDLARNALVASAYVLTGYLGLRLAFVGQSVTLFWPPSGIAFAALWIGRWRLLPGLVVGAFAVNFITSGNLALAALIMAGNTASSVSATYLLRRRLLANPGSGELERVMWFILLAVLAGTLLSASVGTAAVSILGHVDSSVQSTWLVWWMGDAMGLMIVAPPILLFPRIRAASRDSRNSLDAIAFAAAGLGVIAGLAFIHNPIWAVELCKLLTLLLSLWAGARFGLNGPAGMTLLMAAGAVVVTVLGIGPFVRGDFYDSFASVHSYLFAEAAAGMLLAAALADLRRAVEREQGALRELEAASANRIRLMSMISHDLRTPTAGMMGIMQALNQLALPMNQKRLVSFGLRAGKSLTKLIDDILDIARADLRKMVLQHAAFSPAQSLEDVVAMNLSTALSKALELNVELAASLPAFVIGDQVRFEQIVGNLVTNAVAHTAHGKILVTASWEEKFAVEVTDTGPGIPADLVPHIFDAFITSRQQQSGGLGLGLGLHICRQLTELMGGNITYHHVVPTGSRFRVTLPLSKSDQNFPESPTAPHNVGLHILLIDDDEIALEATSALLTSLDHLVTIVDCAEAAVEAVSTRCFDVILTDLNLKTSAMSALNGVNAIRSLPVRWSDCLVLALTGYASFDEEDSYLRAGLDGVLMKPLDASIDLREMIETKHLKSQNKSHRVVTVDSK